MSLTLDQKKALLQEHFLLRHLSEGDLAKLADRTEIKAFAPDTVIFSRGDPAQTMMVVVTGKVQISSPAMEGDKIIFATMHPGDVFGEIALIDGHDRSTDAIATEATEVLLLNRDDFIRVLENNPKLSIDLLRVLCTRIRHTNELLEDFSLIDLRRRLAKRLSYVNESSARLPGGLKMNVRVAQDELVAMMGISQHETIIKQLMLWDQQGIIEIDRGWITVRNHDALKEILAEDF
jgi:CRP/FNR family transcriptional regulator, cyclic AMP receptor protein